MRKLLIIALLVVALAGGFWLWSSSERTGRGTGAAAAGDPDAPLAFVPADTPYVFAGIEPFPKSVTDAWMQQMDMVGTLWRSQLGLAASRLAVEDPDAPALRWLRALEAELGEKTFSQVFEAMGYSMQSRFALYGVGIVPVLRFELGDPAAFRAFVARIEARSGETLPLVRAGELEYWQFSHPEAEVRMIAALQGTHLVVTVAPAADDGALSTLLGVDRPKATMRDAVELVALNAKFGYLPQASGYIDTTRIVTLLGAPPTPLESAFLAALDLKKPTFDAVCQTEYAALAAVAPRLSMGYTELDAKHSNAVSRIELRPDLAQDLMTLRAPMPGMDAVGDSVLNFGISLTLGSVPTLLNKWAGAVATAPWKCETLLGLNQAYEQGRQQAANPMIFAAAPVFQGLHAIISRADIESFDAVPDLAGKLVIGSPNPSALVGMAQSFAPQLAQAQIVPDGKVRPLPALQGLPSGVPAFAAMTERLLGIAVGAGEDATLLAAMKTDESQQPLLVFGYSGAAFVQLGDRMLEAAMAIDDPQQRAESEQSARMMRDLYAMIRRIDFRLEFTAEGIEMQQSATMN